jgi:hypothetical protein
MDRSSAPDIRRVPCAAPSSSSSSSSSLFSSEASRMSLSFATLCVLFMVQQAWLQNKLLHGATTAGDHERDPRQSATTSSPMHQARALLPMGNLSGSGGSGSIGSTMTSTSSPLPRLSPRASSSASFAAKKFQEPNEPYRDPTTSRFRRGGNSGNNNNNNNITDTGTGFLIYVNPAHNGQGTGNIMSGVLAAMLLGEEFQRTVCIVGYEHSFGGAFRWRDAEHRRLCEWAVQGPPLPSGQHQVHPPTLPSDSPPLEEVSLASSQKLPSTTPSIPPPPAMDLSNTIVQNNFDQSAIQSECSMRDMLSNHRDYPAVYYKGNTYPRWPTRRKQQQRPRRHGDEDGNHDGAAGAAGAEPAPRNIFHGYFEPTPELLRMLPWNVDDPPAVVVHLRDGDSASDKRGGLDEATLSLLAGYNFSDAASSSWASSSTSSHHDPWTNDSVFLVSNQVEWYERFSRWSHPPWSLVHHSALRKVSWGAPRNVDLGDAVTDDVVQHPPVSSAVATTPAATTKNAWEREEVLQMWADWYTLLNARRIYHTQSDFSVSAARWNQRIDSWTIRGTSAAIAADRSTTLEAATAVRASSSVSGHTDAADEKIHRHLVLTRDFEEEDDSEPPVGPLVDRAKKDLRYCDPSKRDHEARAYEDMKLKQTLAMMLERRKEREDRLRMSPPLLRGGGGVGEDNRITNPRLESALAAQRAANGSSRSR